MTQLEEILSKLDIARRTAAIDPSEPQYNFTRAGILVRIKEAKDSLVKLTKEYEAAVLKNGVAIFLFGSPDKTKQFADLVVGMEEAVAVDANEMYERIARGINPTIGNSREFTAVQAALLESKIFEITKELNVRLHKRIKVTNMPLVPTLEDLTSYVRSLIRDQIGDSLAAEYLKQRVAIEAQKIRYMLSVAPVIILNATAVEVGPLGSMFGKGKASVTIGKEDTIDKEYITKAFQDVKKSLKKNK